MIDFMEEEIKNEEMIECTIEDIQPTEPPIDWKSKYLYLLAELDNTKKRFNKQIEEVREYGRENVFYDIIVELDALLINEKCTDNEDERERLSNIIKSFYKMLKKWDVERLYSTDARIKTFNSETDNAVMAIPTNDKTLDNTICNIVKHGYRFRNKILRYEEVIVYKFTEENENGTKTD
jgi:molecular chaperone GrpE